MNQREEGDEDERRDVIASTQFQAQTCHSRPVFQAVSMYDHQYLPLLL
jgi:hypothetical protein